MKSELVGLQNSTVYWISFVLPVWIGSQSCIHYTDRFLLATSVIIFTWHNIIVVINGMYLLSQCHTRI
jgi:hypothetical protein